MKMNRLRSLPPLFLFASLLFPVLIFGYPLLFSDSIDYLATGASLNFGTMRPPIYAYMIRLLHWNTSLWPIVIGQAALATWLIWRTMDVMYVCWRHRIVISAAIAISSLPFFVIWVMADVLAGLLVLGAFVAVTRPPKKLIERLLLKAFLLAAGAAHVTYIPLLFGIGFVLLFAAMLWRNLGLSRTAALGVIATSLIALGLLLAANFALYGVVRVTYSSPVLALLRQIEDGLTQRILEEQCPTRSWKLCDERAVLKGATSLWFGFRPDSPLQTKLGGMVGYASEAEEIVNATTRKYWQESLSAGLKRTGALLLSSDGASFGRAAEDQARYLQRMRNAGYVDMEMSSIYSRLIRFPELIIISKPGDLLSLIWPLFLLVGGLIAVRRRASLAAVFLGVCCASIIGNALIIGIGGDVEGRYHGRIAWLAVFACGLATTSTVISGRQRSSYNKSL